MPHPCKAPIDSHTLVMPNFAGLGYNCKQFYLCNERHITNEEAILYLQNKWTNENNNKIREWDLRNQAQKLLDDVAIQINLEQLPPQPTEALNSSIATFHATSPIYPITPLHPTVSNIESPLHPPTAINNLESSPYHPNLPNLAIILQ